MTKQKEKLETMKEWIDSLFSSLKKIETLVTFASLEDVKGHKMIIENSDGKVYSVTIREVADLDTALKGKK